MFEVEELLKGDEVLALVSEVQTLQDCHAVARRVGIDDTLLCELLGIDDAPLAKKWEELVPLAHKLLGATHPLAKDELKIIDELENVIKCAPIGWGPRDSAVELFFKILPDEMLFAGCENRAPEEPGFQSPNPGELEMALHTYPNFFPKMGGAQDAYEDEMKNADLRKALWTERLVRAKGNADLLLAMLASGKHALQQPPHFIKIQILHMALLNQ